MRCCIVLLILLLGGCSASGSKFQQIEQFSTETTTVYVMREWAFNGGATCPDIYLNGKEIGCLKNGGFLRAEVPSGTLYFRVDFFSDNVYETLKVKAGEVAYLQWYYNMNIDGIYGSAISYTDSHGVIVHTESTAIELLKSLRESE